MSTLLSPSVQKAVAGGSAIRKMFEQGIELKKKFGADNVYDVSLGNPDLAPPAAVKAALEKIDTILDNGRFSPLNYVDRKMAEDELARLKG